jgi:hypothetical protein
MLTLVHVLESNPPRVPANLFRRQAIVRNGSIRAFFLDLAVVKRLAELRNS